MQTVSYSKFLKPLSFQGTFPQPPPPFSSRFSLGPAGGLSGSQTPPLPFAHPPKGIPFYDPKRIANQCRLDTNNYLFVIIPLKSIRMFYYYLD